MIQRLLLALALALGLGLGAPAFAADQTPLKSVNAHPTTFGTGDTVGVAHGGTGASSAGGTAVDNISGFASTGFLTRTGAGAYSFQSTTNGITLGNLAQIAANKVLGNATASTANASALSMPSCSTATSALTWTTSSGFGCNSISVGTGTVTTTGSPASGNLAKFSGSTSITSADLSGDCTTSGTLAITCTKLNSVTPGTFFSQNYATPPAIGGTTPAAGAFTTLSATGNTTTNITGSTQCVQASSSGVLSGTGSACGSGGGGGGSTYGWPFTVVQEASFGTLSNGTSFTVTFPSTTASSGNTAFMLVATDGSQAITAPAGWTVDINQAQTGFSRVMVLHKATASDTSATFTNGSVTSFSVYFFELSGSHALDQSSSGGIANAQVLKPPAITPTANSLVFSIACLVASFTPGLAGYLAPPIVLNPAYRAFSVNGAAANNRILIGAVGLLPATNVSTQPPVLSYPVMSLFGGGGIAYSTFSIL